MSTTLLSSTVTDESQIRSLIKAWSRALEARDIEAMTRHYVEDVVLFDAIAPYRTDGLAAYRAAWEQAFPCFPASFRSEHKDLQIHVAGDLAFCHGLHRFVVPDQPDHCCAQSWLRVTACYRKIDGQWKVVHEHVSLPFDPMTGQVSSIPTRDSAQAGT
jgi:uncharacterized protein (TIGR02246 family)